MSTSADVRAELSDGPASGPRRVNIHEAKTHLSKLLAEVEAGAEIIIARAGKPVAMLTPMAPKPRRKFGGYMKLDVPDSFFFDPLPEKELLLWEGRGDEIPGYEHGAA